MNPVNIISLVVSCIMMIVGVTTFIVNVVRNSRADEKAQNAVTDEMKSSLLKLNLMTENINSTTNDIKADVKSLNKNINDIDTRVTLVEKEQQTMWIRIDELKEKNKNG